eukprot:718637-Alexandrium_andersonii.AAC.1
MAPEALFGGRLLGPPRVGALRAHLVIFVRRSLCSSSAIPLHALGPLVPCLRSRRCKGQAYVPAGI